MSDCRKNGSEQGPAPGGEQTAEALREAVERLAILNAVSAAIAASLTPEDLAEALAHQLRHVLPVDAFVLDVYDSEGGQTHELGNYDTIDGEFQRVPSSGSEPLQEGRPSRTVVDSRAPLLVNFDDSGEESEDGVLFGDKSRASATAIFAPLIVANDVTGILSVQSYTSGVYGEQDVELLTAIAQQVAPAVGSALLARKLSQHASMRREILETFDGLRYVTSRDYRLEFLNENYIKEIGRDATGEFCYKALHGLDSVCPWCVSERVFQGETVHQEIQTPRGNRWHYIVSSLIHHADGTTSKQAVILDITDRKLSEERQAALTEGLREVLRAADELIACPDVDTLLRRAVELGRERLGLERCAIFVEDGDAIRGTYGTDTEGRTTDESHYSFPKGDVWARALRVREQTVRQWEIAEADYHEVREDGLVATGRGEVALTPVQNADGLLGVFYNDNAISGRPVDEAAQDVVAVYCSLLAHTIRRKRQEEELEFLGSITEQVSDAFVVTGLDYCITYINEAAENLFGYSLEELAGETPDLLNAEPVAAEIQEDIYRTIGAGKAWTGTHINRRKDGTTFVCEFSVSPMRDRQDRTYAYVGIQRDITERRQDEERIAHLNAVLRAIRNVNQLIARERDRDRLLQRACECLMEARGFQCAWIVLIDEDGGFQGGFSAGQDDGFPELCEMLKDGSPPSCVRLALDEAGVVVAGSEDGALDDCPVRQPGSDDIGMIVRMEHGDRVYGVMAVRLPMRLGKDEEEQELLAELVDDVSLALHAIEEGDERRRAEERQAALTAGLRAVLAAADELIACPDVDTVLRQAVELGREKLGLERCSIFLVGEGVIVGSYGTNRHGDTVDERNVSIPLEDFGPGFFSHRDPAGPKWEVRNDPHMEWDGQEMVAIGEGWTAATPVHSADRPIGVCFNDAAISGAPLDPVKQEVVSVYCSLLGNIIERKRSEEALARRAQETAVMHDLVARLNATDSMDEMLTAALETALALTGLEGGGVYVLDESGGTLVIEHEAGLPEEFTELVREMPLDHPVVRAASEGEAALRFGDIADRHPDMAAVFSQFGLQHVLIAPVQSPEGLVGCMNLAGTGGEAPDAEALRLAGGIGTELGAALRRARAERMAHKRARYMTCVAELSRELLSATDLDAALGNAIGQLREASDADRCYLFENHWGDAHELLTSQRFEACAEGIHPEIDNPQLQNMIFHADGFARWVEVLSDGGEVHGDVAGFPEEERAVLDPQDIRHILILPLIVRGLWHGFIGFDACRPGLRWSRQEVILLGVAAGAISSALERAEVEEEREGLRDLSARLAGVSSLDEIVDVVREVSGRLLGWDAHYFALRAPGEDSFAVLSFVDTIGDEKEIVPGNAWPARSSRPALRDVLAGQPLLIRCVPGDVLPTMAPFGDNSRLSATLMYVPIRSGESVIGVLSAQSYIYNRYSEADLGLLQRIADAVTPALERTFADEALRRSESRFREMSDLLPDAVYETDAEWRLTYANQAGLGMFGYSQGDLEAGIHMGDIVESSDLVYATQRLLQAAESGGPTVDTYDMRRKDGTVIPCEAHSAPVTDSNGALVGFRGVIRDITQRLRAQDTERLASVGQLAAGVAHEFNNLLAIMSGRAQLARALATPDSHDELVESVLRESERGAEVSRNLMGFARPREPRREPILMEVPMDAALSLASRELENSEIEVRRSYRSQRERVHADSGQLQQVFLNLIINACHAMPDGGVLSIETAFEAQDDGPGEVIVAVADTGTGIEPDDIPHIFEPFFTTKGPPGAMDPGGTGLGLSVSHGIVKAHGGTISVGGEYGLGATFELRFAAYDGPEAETPATPARELTLAPGQHAGRCILLVEDESRLRDVIVSVLQERGYHVVSAESTDEALEALACWRFDAVVTDLVMPGGGGHEVLATAVSGPDPPPVIIITGRTDEGLAQELIELGAHSCLYKPFSLPQIIETIEGAFAEEEE